MLTLTRKVGEKIVVHHGLITVEVAKVSGGKVRLKIDAPKELSINRGEVEARIAKEQADAA